MRTIYFDYNATTPLCPSVREAMLPFIGEVWGNPSSIHHVGRKARSLLDDARDRCAQTLKCKPSELIFTSGGTESSNLAILGTARLLREKGRHIITSAIEHHCVLHPCEYLVKKEGFALTVLPVNKLGQMNPEDLQRAFRPDTVLVSLMAANNEIGTVQSISVLGEICRNRGVLFHTDAVQWFGKEPFTSIHQFNADLVSICAHKFHGPKGAGLLFSKSPLFPDQILHGGAHENERRAGTENLSGIIGLAESLSKYGPFPPFSREQLRPLTAKLADSLVKIGGVELLGDPENKLPNTLAFVVENTDSISLLAALDLEGICASSGSACSAGSLEPSHVVSALGIEKKRSNSLVRFSLGRENTEDEVEFVCSVLPDIIRRAQRAK
jgi:cysteine desulfurase